MLSDKQKYDVREVELSAVLATLAYLKKRYAEFCAIPLLPGQHDSSTAKCGYAFCLQDLQEMTLHDLDIAKESV